MFVTCSAIIAVASLMTAEVTEAYENTLNNINQRVTEVHNFAGVFKRVYLSKD